MQQQQPHVRPHMPQQQQQQVMQHMNPMMMMMMNNQMMMMGNNNNNNNMMNTMPPNQMMMNNNNMNHPNNNHINNHINNNNANKPVVVPTLTLTDLMLVEKSCVFDFEDFVKMELKFFLDMPKKKDQEVCKYFVKGFCQKGTACPFRHSKNDRTVVCKHWLRGLCKKGDACEFLHEYNLKKMPECWFFSKYGECSNPECMYLHIDPESKIKECAWYARGFCKHGPECRHKHVKKLLCQNYITGFCPKGPDCPLGHPKYELPNFDGGGVLPHRDSSLTNSFPMGTPGAGGVPFRKDITCFKCNEVGHFANNCPNGGSGNMSAAKRRRMP